MISTTHMHSRRKHKYINKNKYVSYECLLLFKTIELSSKVFIMRPK